MIDVGYYVKILMDGSGLPQSITRVDNKGDATHIVTKAMYGLGTAHLSYTFQILENETAKRLLKSAKDAGASDEQYTALEKALNTYGERMANGWR